MPLIREGFSKDMDRRVDERTGRECEEARGTCKGLMYIWACYGW